MEHVELNKSHNGRSWALEKPFALSILLLAPFDLSYSCSTFSFKVCFSLSGSPLPWPVSRTLIRNAFCMAFGNHGSTSCSLSQLLQIEHECSHLTFSQLKISLASAQTQLSPACACNSRLEYNLPHSIKKKNSQQLLILYELMWGYEL